MMPRGGSAQCQHKGGMRRGNQTEIIDNKEQKEEEEEE